MDDFIIRALLGGVGVALIAGPLGSIVVWRRMAYFGDSLAHSALLGVVLGFLLHMQPIIGVVITAIAMALVMVLMQKQSRFSADTLLGIMAQGSLSIGLVLVAALGTVKVDLMAYLFGDILTVTTHDIKMIWLTSLLALTALCFLWKPLMRVIVHEPIARVEGTPADFILLVIMLMLAFVVAVSIKVVGMLLITSLLIIPAASARFFARIPTQMVILSALLGSGAVAGGLQISLHFDTPSGPSIVVAALGLLLLCWLAAQALGLVQKR